MTIVLLQRGHWGDIAECSLCLVEQRVPIVRRTKKVTGTGRAGDVPSSLTDVAARVRCTDMVRPSILRSTKRPPHLPPDRTSRNVSRLLEFPVVVGTPLLPPHQ